MTWTLPAEVNQNPCPPEACSSWLWETEDMNQMRCWISGDKLLCALKRQFHFVLAMLNIQNGLSALNLTASGFEKNQEWGF